MGSSVRRSSMAIYRFGKSIIGRTANRRVVAAAAYRSGSRLYDEGIDRHHDFSSKTGVLHSEVILPPGAPQRWSDRETLWNEVERTEHRRDSQLAVDILVTLPDELGQARAIELVRNFARHEFVRLGMVADLNVHWETGVGGQTNAHCHILLTTRHIEPEGFGLKQAQWSRLDLLLHWRAAWADHANAELARSGLDVRIDHRSHRARGLALEPHKPVPLAEARAAAEGRTSRRVAVQNALAHRNGDRIIADPTVLLRAITQQKSTFTYQDLARFVFTYTDGKDQFDRAMSAVLGSRETVTLGRDGKGLMRFTSLEMLKTEQSMATLAERLADARDHAVSRASAVGVLERVQDKSGFVLSTEQASALVHIASPKRLALVIGYAGSGKSTMLGLAREMWQRDGYRVRGATLSGIAAESLERGSGITARTLSSLEHAWSRGRDRLGSRDVLVIDEAGLIGSRQMERVLREARAGGSKVVMVGDPAQLQAIEAGAAFRHLAERHGAVELTSIQRQQIAWQREATRQLATGRTDQAMLRYGEAGAVRVHPTRDAARKGLVAGWLAERAQQPYSTSFMLAATRQDVAAINAQARNALHSQGALGHSRKINTRDGPQAFAVGDRVMFLRNDRDLGVKNGTFATLERFVSNRIQVRLDDDRRLTFDLRLYSDLTHGYAATIHKAQGLTLDSVHVLAGPTMDRHSAYVSLTRHRNRVVVHYGRDDFPTHQSFIHALSRDRGKDTTLDYGIDRSDLLHTGPAVDRRGSGQQPLQSDLVNYRLRERQIARQEQDRKSRRREKDRGYELER